MHIAFICHDYPPLPHSGVGTCIASLAEGLVQAGHRATVFVPETFPDNKLDVPERDESVHNGVRVARLCLSSPRWMRWRPGILWQRLRLLWVLKQEHHKNPMDVVEAAD